MKTVCFYHGTYLFIKNWIKLCLQKGSLLCLTKEHVDNPEGQVAIESPQIGSYFLISFIYIKKNSFF